MFTSIINAVVALMTSITTLAGAANKLAVAADNLATVTEEASGMYLDEARANRAIQRKALEAKLNAQP